MNLRHPFAAAARSSRRGRHLFALALAVAAAAVLLAVNVDGGPAAALRRLAAPAHSRELTATNSLARQGSDDASVAEVFRPIRAIESGDDARPIEPATTWPAP